MSKHCDSSCPPHPVHCDVTYDNLLHPIPYTVTQVETTSPFYPYIVTLSVTTSPSPPYRIEHTEVRFGGQAFRLGRYAIHFHLSGLMRGSYIRHCSIHHSNNRAITAHGVHELLIEGNVAYDVKGHMFFVVSVYMRACACLVTAVQW